METKRPRRESRRKETPSAIQTQQKNLIQSEGTVYYFPCVECQNCGTPSGELIKSKLEKSEGAIKIFCSAEDCHEKIELIPFKALGPKIEKLIQTRNELTDCNALGLITKCSSCKDTVFDRENKKGRCSNFWLDKNRTNQRRANNTAYQKALTEIAVIHGKPPPRRHSSVALSPPPHNSRTKRRVIPSLTSPLLNNHESKRNRHLSPSQQCCRPPLAPLAMISTNIPSNHPNVLHNNNAQGRKSTTKQNAVAPQTNSSRKIAFDSPTEQQQQQPVFEHPRLVDEEQIEQGEQEDHRSTFDQPGITVGEEERRMKIQKLQAKCPTLSKLKVSITDSATLDGILRDLQYLNSKSEISTFGVREKEMLITFVPQFSSEKAFKCHEKKKRTFQNIIKYASKDDDCAAVPFILNLIMREWPKIFADCVQKAGFVGFQRMGKEIQNAVLKHANINPTNFKKVIQFLCYYYRIPWFGTLEKDFAKLTDRMPKTECIKMELTIGEKTESIVGLSTEIEEIVRKQIERTCEFELRKNDKKMTIGYKTPTSSNGIVSIMCTDHGADHSQNLIILNTASPQEMRVQRNINHGRLVYPFSTIKCRKDPSDVLIKFTKGYANRGIKKLTECKLLAVKSKGNQVRCVFVPKEARDFSIHNGKISFLREVPNEEPAGEVEMAQDEVNIITDPDDTTFDAMENNLEFWIVINDFTIGSPNDSLAAFLLQGACMFFDFLRI